MLNYYVTKFVSNFILLINQYWHCSVYLSSFQCILTMITLHNHNNKVIGRSRKVNKVGLGFVLSVGVVANNNVCLDGL